MKNKFIWALSTLFLLNTSYSFAQAYRWTDENGQTVYSQEPPPDKAATEIKAPPPPASTVAQEKAAVQKLIDKEQTAEQKEAELKKAQAMKELTAQEKQTNCDKAKEQLSNLQLKTRIKMIGADGQVTMLTPAQKAQEIAKTQEMIKSFCTQ
ncbi:DUF4124 domain-containing protein [Candidatus Berkiella aquae]|uniref:DUF4124 domain-containing protein n=1 Tax=Candidatus Berkiella aquae TaxID=295108 RepID=A0A0Q9YLA3_9GAMM|nr:DUF4124 domain-containing protein [Candidatus Berkiella aquae]MCS5710992.1 DUF4124 domain-containing protein [Candidatus Berkiella aquae]